MSTITPSFVSLSSSADMNSFNCFSSYRLFIDSPVLCVLHRFLCLLQRIFGKIVPYPGRCFPKQLENSSFQNQSARRRRWLIFCFPVRLDPALVTTRQLS